MAQLLILLGGNIGEVKSNFIKATALLEDSFGAVVQQSALYSSEAWGFESDDRFLNQVIEFNCNLTPHTILDITQETEKILGRTCKSMDGYQSRAIDIDILFYGDAKVSDERLIIPHPLLHLRRFTLEPLIELWGEMQHLTLGRTINELYEVCPDKSPVIKERALRAELICS